jgi:hypothetical protein
VHPLAAQVSGVEDVFGGRGQVDLLADGEPALFAREDEQRADEVLGVIDCGADVRAMPRRSPSTTSTVAPMTASGVRSSWEALAMNRCWQPCGGRSRSKTS